MHRDNRLVDGFAGTVRIYEVDDSNAAIVPIFEADGARGMSSLLTRRQMAHVFAGVTRAGAASGRPYGEKTNCGRGSQRSCVEIQTRREL